MTQGAIKWSLPWDMVPSSFRGLWPLSHSYESVFALAPRATKIAAEVQIVCLEESGFIMLKLQSMHIN